MRHTAKLSSARYRGVVHLTILAIVLSAAVPSYGQSTFMHAFNLFDDATPFLVSQTNAAVFDDPVSHGVRYWIPTQANQWAEVVYKFPLSFEVDTAHLDTGIAAFGQFDPGATTYLDVSRDGEVWETVMSKEFPNDLPENNYAYGPGDISSIVAGSETVFVRSRLLSTRTHITGQSFYSQFMRSDTEHYPGVADGGLPTFQFTATGKPTEHGNSVLALHEGANDPITEGWKRERPFAGVSTFPISSDEDYGVSAWAVDDNWSEGLYAREIDLADMTLAMQDGWSLTGTLRIADDATPVGDAITIRVLSNAPTPRHFTLNFGSEVDGSPMAQLGVTGGVIDVSLSNLDSGYHTYQLVFDPTSNAAEFVVDGETRFSGYEGGITTGPESNRNFVSFGSTWSDGTGQGNYSLVKFEILPGSPDLGDNLLHNPGFETAEETVGLPTDYRDWGGDNSEIVSEQGGVTPVGSQMFRFDRTSSDEANGRTGDVLQYVDLSPFQDLVRDGKAVALLTADFNRVTGDDEIDDEFLVLVAAHGGTPASSPGNPDAIGYVSHSVNSDSDPATWQESAVELEIPADADFLQVTLSAIENVLDDPAGSEFDGHFADHASLIVFVRGDFDFSGTIDASDVDDMSGVIREGEYDRFMDLDKNGSVDFLDRQSLITDLLGTTFGDSNLDGAFDSGDLVEVFQAGEYADTIVGNSGWADGDFGGDGEFDSDDLVLAFQTGTYEQTPNASVASVPEPSGLARFLVVLAVVLLRRRCDVSRQT